MDLNKYKHRKKKVVTFTIDEELNEEFTKFCKDKNINKSLFIEDSVREFMEDINEDS